MKKLLLPFVLAGCCLSPTMRLQAEYIKYKDPSVSIPERVNDLMSRMTPEEKTAQLMQMGSHMILDNGKLNPQKLHAVCRDAGIGFFEGITMTGPQAFQIMNDVQRYMIDSTRLGIPVFTLSESLHGAVNDGCTILSAGHCPGQYVQYGPLLPHGLCRSRGTEDPGHYPDSQPRSRRMPRLALGACGGMFWRRPATGQPDGSHAGPGLSGPRHLTHAQTLRPPRRTYRRTEPLVSFVRPARAAFRIHETV